MSFWPILLRVLISISLILNGAASAAASAQMPIGHMASVSAKPVSAKPQPAADAVATVGVSCGHHHQLQSDASTAGELAAAVQDETPIPSQHSTPGCCKSSTCACVCVQQVQATVASHTPRYALVEHPRGVRRLQPGHAAPALPHLIRPPIIG